MRRLMMAVVALTLVLAVVPATAEEGEIEPTFEESQVYFECVGGDPMKLQNTSTPIPWVDEAPDRSVQDGAGCGFLDPQLLYNDSGSEGMFDPVFAGEVAGNLTNLTVEVHMLGQHPDEIAYGDFPLFVWLRVDGEDVFYGPEAVELLLETSETGASQKGEFTLTGLDKHFATEDGVGEQVRHVELTVAPWHEESLYAPWVWGTTEVPAGITFNDTSPSWTRVPVP